MLAILDLGQLLKEQDRFAEALECFDRAIALEPDAGAGAFPARRDARARLVHAARRSPPTGTASSCGPGTPARCSGSGTCSRPSATTPGRSPPTTPASSAGPGLRRDLLEPRQPEDLPLRRRDRRRDGKARGRAGRLAVQSRGQFPVRARQGLRGPRRLRARLGTTTGAATRGSARRSPTTRCRPKSMNDRLVATLHGGVPRVGAPARATPIPRRSSSSACRAPARRCSSRSSRATPQVEGTASCPTSAASRPR